MHTVAGWNHLHGTRKPRSNPASTARCTKQLNNDTISQMPSFASSTESMPVYQLIAHRVYTEHERAYAFDLFDAIEYERRLRNDQNAKGLLKEALQTEAIRNQHISELSKLMSHRVPECPLTWS